MMARFVRAVILTVSFLIAGTAFAAGGTCPSGANYVNSKNPTGPLVTLSSLGVTNCFYVSAAGSDTNSGTTESSPWAHAPGMPNCATNCAGITPVDGEGFIFRGGDTWHFGNSGAAPYTGGTWDWGAGGWNGTSSNPIYIGVDSSWFSGGAWARPILTGDNPLPAAGNVTASASCSFQAGNNNDMVSFGAVTYVAFDNFEQTGMCQSSTGQPSGKDQYLSSGCFGQHNCPVQWWTRNYQHGWSGTCVGGGGCNSNGNLQLVAGGSPHIWFHVIDGSDSYVYTVLVDGAGSGIYDIAYSVIRYAAEMLGNDCHIFHDNLIEHWGSTVHPNLFECTGERTGTNAVYNNVWRHICSDSNFCPVGGLVGIWPEPDTSTTDYYFNNIGYDEVSVEFFNIGTNGQTQGPVIAFNNTFEYNTLSGTPIFSCTANSTAPFTSANNHFIYDGASAYSNCAGFFQSGSAITDRLMTHAAATAAGYTASEGFAYSPTSSNSPTVGTGTNRSVYCSALSTAAISDSTLSDAASACQNDTRYACLYNVSNHSNSCPSRTANARPATAAWDQGAYQGTSTQSSAPNPPTGLTVKVL